MRCIRRGHTADTALRELQVLQKEYLVELGNICVVIRTDEALARLSSFKGTIVHTSPGDEQERRLRAALSRASENAESRPAASRRNLPPMKLRAASDGAQYHWRRRWGRG